MSRYLIFSFLMVCVAATAPAQDEVNAYLAEAEYDMGIRVYTEKVGQSPQQADLFALATLQFMNGAEDFMQGLYRFGMKSESFGLLRFVMPLAIIPVPENKTPQTVRPEDLALLVQNWHDALGQTEKTLAEMNGVEFKLRLNLGQAAMDINGDGQADEKENLLEVCRPWFGRVSSDGTVKETFYVNCDHADALWLQGYCQLLMGLLDILQAHDWTAFYAKTAHVLFASPDKGIIYPYARTDKKDFMIAIIDIVSLLHEFHLEVVHPEKYPLARDRFLEVIRLSRVFWEVVDKETDDDHEWIPNVRQTSVSGAKVTQEMIDGWKQFLNEMELILKGRKLIPHFRVQKEYGINLAKLVDNPGALDAVEWWSGVAAVPYLEKGDITDPENWTRFTQAFSGNFMRTAVWFN